MARIYYHEEKLSGVPIQSTKINAARLQSILQQTDLVEVDLQLPNADDANAKAYKGQHKRFNKVVIRRDGFYYEADRGRFYLPRGLIFFDHFDYNFPSEFYFLAKIHNQVECRKCIGGKHTQWYHIPDLHQPVRDPQMLNKIENTFIELEERINQNTMGNIHENPPAQIDHLPLNRARKQAYHKLTELCVQNFADRKKIEAFIETLRDYEGDPAYLSTFNYFADFLDQEQLSFLMCLDCKAAIEDLEWMVSSRLRQQYNLNLALPQPEDFPERSSISLAGVLRCFDRVLRRSGLQLRFIDTQSDEYVVILHRISDKEAIAIAIKGIGYHCYEA